MESSVFNALNVPLVLESDGSAESNTTLLLAGKWDWSERGEPRNAFDGEHLTAGHSVDVLRKVEVCVCVCMLRYAVCYAERQLGPQEVTIIIGSVIKVTFTSFFLSCNFN